MTKCTTHHHACDCREAKFRELEAENAKLRDAAQAYLKVGDCSSWGAEQDALIALLEGRADDTETFI